MIESIQDIIREKFFALKFANEDSIEDEFFLYQIGKDSSNSPDFLTIKNDDENKKYSIFGNKIFSLKPSIKSLDDEIVEEEDDKNVKILSPQESASLLQELDDRLTSYCQRLGILPNSAASASGVSKLKTMSREK